jgi:uncharacterized protein (DUF1697 family)
MTAVQRRVVLIRAVNVGPARLPMEQLRAIATELGATTVSTYIASGNLIADVPAEPEAFDRALERALEARFGWFRECISRSPRELSEALAAHPFEVVNPGFSYISFMPAKPRAKAIAAAADVPTGEDRWQVIGRDLHLRYAHGAGKPELKDAKLLKALGQPATARNLRTIQSLIDIAKG